MDTWFCCKGRAKCFSPFAVACVVTLSVIAISFAIVAWFDASFSLNYSTYTVSGPIASSPASHLLAGSLVMSMSLPNNLADYVGKFYHIDCASLLAHSITIAPGTLPTTWDGTHRVATCTLGAGGGLSFRVISPGQVRIVGSTSVTFT